MFILLALARGFDLWLDTYRNQVAATFEGASILVVMPVIFNIGATIFLLILFGFVNLGSTRNRIISWGFALVGTFCTFSIFSVRLFQLRLTPAIPYLVFSPLSISGFVSAGILAIGILGLIPRFKKKDENQV